MLLFGCAESKEQRGGSGNCSGTKVIEKEKLKDGKRDWGMAWSRLDLARDGELAAAHIIGPWFHIQKTRFQTIRH
jgi:hypothetical protein